ncbi:MAG: transposase [Actinomycetota bacterium]
MARPLRIEYPGAVYHVMSRGDGRKSIVRTNKDREAFLVILEEAAKRFNVLIHGYCLMTNHYHLLVETPDGNLAEVMHYINGVYTTRYNARNKTVGHVYQGRYKAILVERDEYLLCLCRYIVLNPIRAGLVEHPADYRWSSYRAIAGLSDNDGGFLATDWVLSQFAGKKRLAKKRYQEFVLTPEAGSDKPFENIRGGCVLGSDTFIDKLSNVFWEADEIKELARSHRYADRPPLSALLPAGLSISDRNLKAHSAIYDFGYKQREVANHLGLHRAYLSRVISETEKYLNEG